MDTTTKTCTKCNVVKPLEMFSRQGRGDNNFATKNYEPQLKAACKSCNSEYAREFRKRNKNYKGSGKLSKYKGDDKLLISAIRRRFSEAKLRDKKRGFVYESDADADYLFDMYKEQSGICRYSGIPLKIQALHLATLSLDKILPEKGYNKGNVQWVCWAVNRAKGEMPEYDFIRMCGLVTERCNDYRKAS